MASQFANGSAPRQPDDLLIVDNAAEELKTRAPHCLLYCEEVVTARNDETFLEPEAFLHCRFNVLKIFVGDGYGDDSLVESPLEVFAYRRAFNAEAFGNFRLLHVFEVIHRRDFD